MKLTPSEQPRLLSNGLGIQSLGTRRTSTADADVALSLLLEVQADRKSALCSLRRDEAAQILHTLSSHPPMTRLQTRRNIYVFKRHMKPIQDSSEKPHRKTWG